MGWMTATQLAKFKSVGREVKIADDVVVFGPENIEIGDNVRIDTGCVLLASADGAWIKIGSHIHIASRAIFMASGGIELGDFSTVSFQAQLISASDTFDGSYLIGPVFDPEFIKVKKSPIRTQMHCSIAAGSTLLPGAWMLEGSVLGAMSMLKERTQPWTIYGGVPAKPIGTRSLKALAMGEEWEAVFNSRYPKD